MFGSQGRMPWDTSLEIRKPLKRKSPSLLAYVAASRLAQAGQKRQSLPLASRAWRWASLLQCRGRGKCRGKRRLAATAGVQTVFFWPLVFRTNGKSIVTRKTLGSERSHLFSSSFFRNSVPLTPTYRRAVVSKRCTASRFLKARRPFALVIAGTLVCPLAFAIAAGGAQGPVSELMTSPMRDIPIVFGRRFTCQALNLSGAWKACVQEGLARPEGLEPPTYWFEASRSIQLSYGRAVLSLPRRAAKSTQSFIAHVAPASRRPRVARRSRACFASAGRGPKVTEFSTSAA